MQRIPDIWIARFWEKVTKTDGCWIWTASKRNKGYGAFVWVNHEGKTIQDRAHRFSYALHHGEIEKNKMILHQCDNPACVNPAHLTMGTNLDNINDMLSKGRHVAGGTHCGTSGNWKRGSNHHATKLTLENVKTIRNLYRKGEYGYMRLAKQFNIHQSSVFKIIKRETYKYV